MSLDPSRPDAGRLALLPDPVRIASAAVAPVRIAPGARARLLALLGARGSRPQVLWLRGATGSVEGEGSGEGVTELAIVDRPAVAPPGFVLYDLHGIGLLLEARDEPALAGLRLEAAAGGALRLVRPEADEAVPVGDGSCGSCASSAPVPAFRTDAAPPSPRMMAGAAGRSRGPSLPVLGQDVPVGTP